MAPNIRKVRPAGSSCQQMGLITTSFHLQVSKKLLYDTVLCYNGLWRVELRRTLLQAVRSAAGAAMPLDLLTARVQFEQTQM